MGLPSRSAVRSTEITVEHIDLRFTAFLGDSRVYLSHSGSEIPRLGEIDRIDNGTIQAPRIAIYDTASAPGLLDVAEAVKAAAIGFYRNPETYQPTAKAAATTGNGTVLWQNGKPANSI